MVKPALLILCCASLGWACPKNSSEWRDGVCVADIKPEGVAATDSAKWVSNEKPPRTKNNPWEASNVHVVNLQNTDVADRSHPPTCAKECVWTGAQCLCNQDPNGGRKP